ncbi:glycosyltransferase [Rhodococcoides corynebacterioides]|uniref:Glycosyltransferase n=1 Tax=Rhodococcoides corynebacterioides TaxID=53972 RepID=A0ABS7P515_9NOCA|nr:glycosyltransferase [Rhodococcus corynebacterioides]MBY6367519.1 glycosyltransferase [Rhodococcus corynebacterioides]MBY6407211.1 glycosyltransferase [Rhodococcus corynebacterioides]
MIVWYAGACWDGIVGTDRCLVEEVARHEPVVWVDPVVSVLRARGRRATVTSPHPNVQRIRVVGPPGVTRPGVRALSRALRDAAVARHLRRHGHGDVDVVAASPDGLPTLAARRTLFYLTDDWVAGSTMMGLSRSFVQSRVAAAVRGADVVAAVAPDLVTAARAQRSDPHAVVLLPNGYRTEHAVDPRTAEVAPAGRAVLSGQLNERLDVATLDAIVDRGVEVEVVGPRTDRDPAFSAELSRWLGRSGVRWHGTVSPPELPHRLRAGRVGLVPYANSEFNRASFPLKTLDYLGAGLPVVSSDLPASRWFESDHVRVTTGPQQFADGVAMLARATSTPEEMDARVALATLNGWDARARSVLALLGR